MGIQSILVTILVYLSIIPNALGSPAQEMHQVFSKHKLTLVSESAFKRVKKILLFAANPASLKLHSSFINSLGRDVQYYIVLNPQIGSKKFMEKIDLAKVDSSQFHFIEYENCFTPWVQDYFLRMTDGKYSFLQATYSDNLQSNECKPFEVGLPQILQNKWSDNFSSQLNQTDIFQTYRIDRKNGDLYADSPGYQNFFPMKVLKMFYGEGGMRIPTEKFLFIERTDWTAIKKRSREYSPELSTDEIMTSYFRNLFEKQIITVGDDLDSNTYYSYHIDMFLTPVELKGHDPILFLGHPSETEDLIGLEQLKLIKGYNAHLWQDKVQKANIIEAEMKRKGFRVQRLPILFLENFQNIEQTITFNNVIQSLSEKGEPTLFIPGYDMGLEKNIYQTIMKKVSSTFSLYGLKAQFVFGAENLLDLNGQLRCSMGVLLN